MITLYTFGPGFGLPDPSPFVMKAEVLLKMSGLAYETAPADVRKAPKGKLPYISDGGKIIPDSTFIRDHLERAHHIDFDTGLTAEQRAIGWALEKMCEEHLYWAIVDARWMVDANFDKGPRHFFDIVPAMARPLVVPMIRRDVKRTLHGQGFGRHTHAEIESLAARDLGAIAAVLGTKPYLFGDAPHAADASVFASVASALCPLFDTPIRSAAEGHANLAAYRDRCLAHWYPGFSKSASAG